MEKGDHQGGNSSSSSQQPQQSSGGGAVSTGGSGEKGPRSHHSHNHHHHHHHPPGGGRGRGRNSAGRGRGGRHHHHGRGRGASKTNNPNDYDQPKEETQTHSHAAEKPNGDNGIAETNNHNKSAVDATATEGGENNIINNHNKKGGRGFHRGGGGRSRGGGRTGNRSAGRHHGPGRGGRSAAGRGEMEKTTANVTTESSEDGHKPETAYNDSAADPKKLSDPGPTDSDKTVSTAAESEKNGIVHHGSKKGRGFHRGGRGGGRGGRTGNRNAAGRGRGHKPSHHNKHKLDQRENHDNESELQKDGTKLQAETSEAMPGNDVKLDNSQEKHQQAKATEEPTYEKPANDAKEDITATGDIHPPKEVENTYTSMECATTKTTAPASPSSLSLPKPPKVKGGKGGPVILMRKNQDNNNSGNVVMNNNNINNNVEEEKKAADEQDINTNPRNPDKEKKKKKPRAKARKEKKKKREKELEDEDDEEPEEEDEDSETEKQPSESATDTLKSLPAQEVSITASTKVEVKLKGAGNSSASLTKLGEKSENPSKSKKSKNKKIDSTKAARKFNNDVRMCVERSDPDTMRTILRNKKNHHYALDAIVLETVMKAYLMAAMFDDALYCLRNCALPGTLSTLQTERILTCLPQNLRNSSAFTAADMINGLCVATEFDSPTSRTYFMRIVRGIALEFLEEATSARDRICSAPCERLVRSGVCVVDARLKRGKKATELVVIPGEQLGVFVPDSMENRGIQAGDAVSILPYAGPYPMSAESLDRNMVEATVINTNPTVLRLQDKTNATLHSMLTEQVEGNVYRIDKLANRMGFNRQLSAAVAVASPFDPEMGRDIRRPCPQLIQAITAMDENIDRVMKQPGGFGKTGQLTSTAALCSEASPWSYHDEDEDLTQDEIRQTSHLALEKYKALEGLNLSQRLAVEGATSNRLTLIQGPPGTGKTAVAIRILQHWARLAKSTPGEAHSPILATSDSNIAVDNLVEGCAAVGLSVVRLGRPEAIRPELLRYCIDRPPSSYSNSNGQSYGATNAAYKDRIKTLKSAQVICCTCIGSGGDILDSMTFDRVLVDEATQATEPAVLVPLMRGCRQLVLVGDHCQLPPTVLSTRAEEEGHGVPLFSRMVACGVPPFMLDTQYRMHPCIAMFPSDLFYGGKLKNGVTAPERRPLAGFPWPREEFPVAYIPVQGIEMDDGVSKYNELEAEAACRAVQALLEGGQCTVSDIAVCTPYAAQARLIRRMTRRLLHATGPPYIEVSSVDGFQGREKEAVVFSAVRSNDYGAIGFTSDWRRVNVSFTRARRALIVIGNDVTLRRGDPDTWMPWLAWADAHGINMDKPGIPRGRYDPEQLRRVRGGTTAAEMLRDVLERQQAQLKSAQDKFDKAQKGTAGHIRGVVDNNDDSCNMNVQPETNGVKALTLEEDLALLENADGHWDDSDDEDHGEMRHSTSVPTLTSGASSNRLTSSENGSDDSPADAWDL